MATVKDFYESLGRLLRENPEIAEKDILEGGGNPGRLNIFRYGPDGKIKYVSFEDEEYMQGYIEQADEYVSELNVGELSEQHKEYLVQMCIEERSEKEILQYIKDYAVSAQKNSEYNILEDYTESEIEQKVYDYVKEAINLADMSEEITIKGVKVYGSRTRQDYENNSDLDVLVEYEGDFKEYLMFNLLHDDDEPFVLNDIPVDINPIRAEESGTIEEYYNRVKDFRKEGNNEKEYITEEKLQDIMKDALEARGYEVTEEKLEELWEIYEDCQQWNEIGEMTTGFSYDEVVDFVKHSSSVDEVFNEAFNTEFEKANEHYKLVTGKYMDAEFAEAHADKLILCYEKAIDYINIDFWAVYEDLLDKNLTYREYVYIDSHNIFNPFEVKPSDINTIQELRKDLDAFREKYKDAIDSLCENLNMAEDSEHEREVEFFVPVFETDKHVCIYYYEDNNEWYAVDKETGNYKLILDDSYVWVNKPSLNIFADDTVLHIAEEDLMFNLADSSKYLISSAKGKVLPEEDLKGIKVIEKALEERKNRNSNNLSLNAKIQSASNRIADSQLFDKTPSKDVIQRD